MAVIRYKNQSEYAFLIWMGNFPDSGHPLDQRRFYTFAKSVARYRSKKWLNYAYFEKRVLEHTPHFDTDHIEDFWDKLNTLVTFHHTPPIPTVGDSGDRRHGLFQRGVNQGKMYEVPISQAEYYGKGASKETMKQADYFG